MKNATYSLLRSKPYMGLGFPCMPRPKEVENCTWCGVDDEIAYGVILEISVIFDA